MSVILGWSLPVTVLVICIPMIAYTTIGGVQAVAWTDVKQMFIVVFSMSAAVVILLRNPSACGIRPGAQPGGSRTGRLKAVDFSFNLSETYTFWSAMLGGTFLMLVLGCDQSQVQRYLTAKSIDEARQSLMMSAWVKIRCSCDPHDRRAGVRVLPVQHAADVQPRLRRAGRGPARGGIRRAAAGVRRGGGGPRPRRHGGGSDGVPRERHAAQGDPREALAVVKQASGDDSYNDVNYVFPTFITTVMPIGLVGLMIAAIFAAAMSASGGELNSLATATVIDFYKRHFKKDATDGHYVFVSRLATFGWGLFACLVAMRAANQGSLIEVVNRYGSVVYGSLLGVFILAILTKRATARGAFWGTIAGMAAVLYVYNWVPWIAFLWHNLIGAVVVVVVGMAISYTQRPTSVGSN
jgi:Na+/proline symporter